MWESFRKEAELAINSLASGCKTLTLYLMITFDRQRRIVHLAVATLTLPGASTSPLPLMVKKIGEGETGWHNIKDHLRDTLERRRIDILAPNSVVLVRKGQMLLLLYWMPYSHSLVYRMD